MEQKCNNEERELGSKNVKQLIIIYTLSAFVGMALQMVIGIADGFFVGNGIGANGLATVGIVYPFWIIAISLGTLIGVGTSSLVAIKLGEGNTEEARSLVGQGFWYSAILSILVTIFIYVFMDNILMFLGAKGDLLISTKEYTKVFLLGFPMYVMGLAFIYLLRVDEKPMLGTLIMSIPPVVATIAEYIFIFKMHMGVAGSALGAWVITMGPYAIAVLHFIFGKTNLKIKLSDIRLNLSKLHEINKIGFAAFIITSSGSIVTIIINNQIGKYGTEMDLAVYGVLNAFILYVLISITQVFCMGLLPVAGYNYGAKLYERVKEALIISIKITLGFFIILVGILFLFANQILTFYCGNVSDMILSTKSAMLVFLMFYPLGSITILTSTYFQSIEKNSTAIYNAMTRNVIFIIPLLYVLPIFFRVKGIWMSEPIADIMSFIVAIYFINKEVKHLSLLSSENNDKKYLV